MSWLSPSLMLQGQLNRLAGTGGGQYVEYQTDIVEYHHRLREFYYPLLFEPSARVYSIDWRSIVLAMISLSSLLCLSIWRLNKVVESD